MRLGLILLILLFVALGALFGALNSDSIVLDLYFGVVQLPKGVALLGVLLLGWFVGGLVVYLGLVLRLRRRLRTLTRDTQQRESRASNSTALAKPSDIVA